MKYKILVFLTFLLPISSFLLYSAITGQTYDAEVFNATNLSVEVYDDGFVVFDDEASYNGYLIPYNESYALFIYSDDIVKVGREYFTIYNGAWTNFDDVPNPQQTSSKWAVSVTTIIGILIVGLIIGGKMDWLKSHPRTSAFVSLLVGTFILWGINSVIEDLLHVFIIATGTMGVYLIEYGWHNGIITAQQAEKANAELLSLLKGGK